MAAGATDCDVLIFGGGLAGLTASRQLKLMRPETDVVVIEKREHPVPEAAYKVGESVAEIGAHYLKDLVDFKHHMEEQQLRKFSLRIFSPNGDNKDIAIRPELGLHKVWSNRTYQIDRGRLENALAEEAPGMGVNLLDGHSVSSFELGDDRHSVTVRQNGTTKEFRPRWIMDCSGRAGILRKHLKLGVEIPHDVNACWFRLELTPDRKIDSWSDDEGWRARVPNGRRWVSTNHLVGEGYWIWMIPLPSDSISIGVVADPKFVPFERIRRYPEVLEFLNEFEPQLASKLPDSEDGLMDFRKLKNYAYGARRGLSPQRWCLTGEAGLFLDPLYATGLDFVAVSNTLATRLICEHLSGEAEADFRRRLKIYNSTYLGQFMGWGPAFAGQYEVFRDGVTTQSKVIWDNVLYFMYPSLLGLQDYLTDHEFVAKVRDIFKPHYELNVWMQQRFRELCQDDCDVRQAGFAAATDHTVEEMFLKGNQKLSKDEVEEIIRHNVRRMRDISEEMLTRLYGACGKPVPDGPWQQIEGGTGEDLIHWTPYERKTSLPSQTDPPPDTYMVQ
ncbi:MAG TPA: NAD(P)/FAD-dependent oxidoreductase [Thermoleophilaceae bacterium]|jgi:flavin-dependent dehydrogenase